MPVRVRPRLLFFFPGKPLDFRGFTQEIPGGRGREKVRCVSNREWGIITGFPLKSFPSCLLFEDFFVADPFDPYREALVTETNTIWPEELGDVSTDKRTQVDEALHANPADCADIQYVRVHTGFCRTITVTQADLDRVG